MPEFVQEETEDFLVQFEKIAELRGWPEEEWALLVQTRLKGKAREAYAGLGIEKCSDYKVVKEAILQTVKVNSEVCRQCFRDIGKTQNNTYLEVAREIVLKCDKWLKSEDVKSKEDVIQLLMLEHFRNILKPKLKFEIMKLDIKNVIEAGRKADQLVVAYGLSKGASKSNQRWANSSTNSWRGK